MELHSCSPIRLHDLHRKNVTVNCISHIEANGSASSRVDIIFDKVNEVLFPCNI